MKKILLNLKAFICEENGSKIEKYKQYKIHMGIINRFVNIVEEWTYYSQWL